MKRMINFGSIEQFRTIVKNIQFITQRIGYDEEKKEPIIDKNITMPTIKALASEKIHGTNAAVCYSHPDGMWVQSRKNIITTEKDNAGCAFAIQSKTNEWMKIINKLINEYEIDCNKNIISIYFEWCGGNIQKNAAVSGLDKRVIIFQHFKVSPIEKIENEDANQEVSVWYETKIKRDEDNNKYIEYDYVSSPENNIFNIMNFPTYEIEIDFSRPDLAQNKMIKLVEETIEPNSPVGRKFNKENNIGEGIVVTFMYKNVLHRFKVKGEKHSVSKVKTLKPIDSVKEQNKIDFVNYACPAWRLEQAWQELFGIENEKEEPDIKKTGDFIRLVIKDILKEEIDVLKKHNLELKEVNGLISKLCSKWFINQINTNLRLN